MTLSHIITINNFHDNDLTQSTQYVFLLLKHLSEGPNHGNIWTLR